ncbi:hypothetical protein [Arcticibacter tournemirensis]|uniref:Uncharacterized protein n=1 Tax=Arcticibacter tournemirensis TaxID=699437 RepID=A0A4V1KHM6_9SPHI|nr:hypothetical protein [Arcticibacter tournemirensis]RXF67722.1 hypothetical protein EKH83_18000 [Arcticibacter tournemirensis]
MEKSKEHILQFIDSYSPEESKMLLWALLKCAVAGNIAEMLPIERQNLLSFYEMLAEMIDGVYDEYSLMQKQMKR